MELKNDEGMNWSQRPERERERERERGRTRTRERQARVCELMHTITALAFRDGEAGLAKGGHGEEREKCAGGAAVAAGKDERERKKERKERMEGNKG